MLESNDNHNKQTCSCNACTHYRNEPVNGCECWDCLGQPGCERCYYGVCTEVPSPKPLTFWDDYKACRKYGYGPIRSWFTTYRFYRKGARA